MRNTYERKRSIVVVVEEVEKPSQQHRRRLINCYDAPDQENVKNIHVLRKVTSVQGVYKGEWVSVRI